MHKYKSKCRWNMLLQVDDDIVEIRPGEIFRASSPVDSRYLEEIKAAPKPKKKKVEESADVSGTQS